MSQERGGAVDPVDELAVGHREEECEHRSQVERQQDGHGQGRPEREEEEAAAGWQVGQPGFYKPVDPKNPKKRLSVEEILDSIKKVIARDTRAGAAVERKERLPLSFVIGAHPLDFMSAAIKVPMDEFALVATLRGETLPMVRGITNGIPVPADAEMVLEGYLDEHGYAEKEGPYGELYGYYGPMHMDPVFHVTAITMRRDRLHHTVLHGGPQIRRNDASLIGGLSTEARVWHSLKAAGFDVADVHCPESATGLHICRVAIRQKAEGDARRAISELFKMPLMRLIYIVDPDVDVHSHEAMDWAQCTRFRADRDYLVEAFNADRGRYLDEVFRFLSDMQSADKKH